MVGLDGFKFDPDEYGSTNRSNKIFIYFLTFNTNKNKTLKIKSL